jgi:uncharacterized phage protein (TIGR01671 family)
MREIKFRAWNKTDSKMVSWEEMYGIERAFDGGVGVHLAISDQCYLLPEGCVVMQFTGLKDRQGKEIYEGDVVKIDGGAEPVIAPIGFEYGCFVVKWKANAPELKYYIGMSFCSIEIIGNIYENPELLKQEV